MIKFLKSVLLKALAQSEYPALKGAKEVLIHEVSIELEDNIYVISFVLQANGKVFKDSISLLDFMAFLCKEHTELQLKYDRIISNNPKLAK